MHTDYTPADLGAPSVVLYGLNAGLNTVTVTAKDNTGTYSPTAATVNIDTLAAPTFYYRSQR